MAKSPQTGKKAIRTSDGAEFVIEASTVSEGRERWLLLPTLGDPYREGILSVEAEAFACEMGQSRPEFEVQ